MVGATIGGAVVVELFLNMIELAALKLFISSLENGRLIFRPEIITNSSTFWKILVGAILGGAGGVTVAQTIENFFGGKKRAKKRAKKRGKKRGKKRAKNL